MKQAQNTLTRADVSAILARLYAAEYERHTDTHGGGAVETAATVAYWRALADVSEQADAMLTGTFYRDADAIQADGGGDDAPGADDLTAGA